MLVCIIPNMREKCSYDTMAYIELFEGRKEMFYLTTHSTPLVNVIWRRTYGKGPFRYRERKPAAATWATISGYQQLGYTNIKCD